jgi:hypothetical protein
MLAYLRYMLLEKPLFYDINKLEFMDNSKLLFPEY